MAKRVKKDYFYAAGKRRSSSASIRLYKGKGENTVNSIPMGDYFQSAVSEILLKRPFKLTNQQDKYYFTAKVAGGGKNGQLEAVVHALAKAFAGIDKNEFRAVLKKDGLLIRDPRVKERRKVGTGGKARRKKQSPKR